MAKKKVRIYKDGGKTAPQLTYADSMALYKKGEADYAKYLEYAKKKGIPKAAMWEDPTRTYIPDQAIQPIVSHGFYHEINSSNPNAPDRVAGIEVNGEIPSLTFRYKKPVGSTKKTSTPQPIYVESKNDPRYKRYQDSLLLANESEKAEKYLMSPNTKTVDDWSRYMDAENLNRQKNAFNRLNGPIPVREVSKALADGKTPAGVHIYKQPVQQVIAGQPLNKLPIGYQPQGNIPQMQKVEVLPIPNIQPKGWYSNKQNIPIDADDDQIQQLYNEDGSRKYQYGGWLNKYQKGGKTPLKAPQSTTVDGVYNPYADNIAKLFKLTPQQIEYNQREANRGTIRDASPRKTKTQKAVEIARHPLTALTYKTQGQPIPDNLGAGEQNPYDQAVAIFNPLTYIDAAKRTVTAEHLRNMHNLQDLPGALGATAMDAAMIYGVGRGVYEKATPSHSLKPIEVRSQNVSQRGTPFNQEFDHNTIIGKIDNEGNFKIDQRYKQSPEGYNVYEQIPESRTANIKPKMSPELEQEIKNRYNTWQDYRKDLSEYVKNNPGGSGKWLKPGESYTTPSGRTYTNNVGQSQSIRDVIFNEENLANHFRQKVGIDVQKLRNTTQFNPLLYTGTVIPQQKQRSRIEQIPISQQSVPIQQPVPVQNKPVPKSTPKKPVQKKIEQKKIQDTVQQIESKHPVYQYIREDSQGRTESDKMQTPVEPEWFQGKKQYGGKVNKWLTKY